MSDEEIFLRGVYSQVKQKVDIYNQKLSRKLTPSVPEFKKRVVKGTKHGKTFIRFLQKEEDIPDELFIKYFDLRSLDEEIAAEVSKYIRILGLHYEIGEFDIMDLVSNPKSNGMTYIESLNRLYDESDSVDFEERTFSKHMTNLRRNWIMFNEARMCLWGSAFDKIGDKFYISNFNGSHLTCLCKLIAVSGMTDKELSMPEGFVKSLKCIRTQYRNTPDDLEFVLFFNRMYDIMQKTNPDVKFYLRESDIKGINIIGIQGTEIRIQNVRQLMEYMKRQSILACGTSQIGLYRAFRTVDIDSKDLEDK